MFGHHGRLQEAGTLIDCRAGGGVKGDSIGGAKCAAGYHGDAVSQATVTAATRAPRFAKAGAWSGSK